MVSGVEKTTFLFENSQVNDEIRTSNQLFPKRYK